MEKILCVEDGEDTLLLLAATLDSHQLIFARTLKHAIQCLTSEVYSLVIIDVDLPDGSGLEVLAATSEQLRGTPIIFLTGKSDFATKVSAFSLGADDYIQKPFDPKELRLRVDSKLRKTAHLRRDDTSFKMGPVTVNVQEQRIYSSDACSKPIELTSLEFRIFQLLARTQNKIFSRDEILDRVWGNSFAVTDRAVDVHVSNLRKKLAGTGVTIEAVIGSGYRVLVSESRGPTNPTP